MNLQDREKLYVEHMKCVLDQWMNDTHRLKREQRTYTKITLEQSYIDELFDRCKNKLKEFYGIDEDEIDEDHEDTEKDQKINDHSTKTYLSDFRINLGIGDLLVSGLNIRTIEELVKYKSEDLMRIRNFGRKKLESLIYHLDIKNIPHNFEEIY